MIFHPGTRLMCRGFSLLRMVRSAGRTGSLLEGAFGQVCPAEKHYSPLQRLHAPPFLQLPCGCRSSRTGAVAATLQRIPSASAEIQRNPLQPEPPRVQPLRRSHNGTRGSGGNRVFDSPRRLCAAFDARKRPPTRTQGQHPKEHTPSDCVPLRQHGRAGRAGSLSHRTSSADSSLREGAFGKCAWAGEHCSPLRIFAAVIHPQTPRFFILSSSATLTTLPRKGYNDRCCLEGVIGAREGAHSCIVSPAQARCSSMR